MATIEERERKHGTCWYVRYRDGKDSRQRVFPTRVAAETYKLWVEMHGAKEAERLLTKDDGKQAVEVADGPASSVAACVDWHIRGLSGVTKGTLSDYRTYLDLDIAQTPLGALPLSAVTREAIGAWVTSLTQPRQRRVTHRGTGLSRTSQLGPLSGKSIRNRHSLLSAALRSAVRAGHMATNHAEGIRLPRTDHAAVEMTLLTLAQQDQILDAVDDKWRDLVEILMLTGLRFGEATALTVGHIRFAEGVLLVRQAWKHVDGGELELGPPKSKKSRRSVVLSPRAMDVLWDACHVLTGDGPVKKPDDAYVFTASSGLPVRHSTFYEGGWAPAMRRAGLSPRPRIHDLRHSYASMLIAQNVPANHIQRQLGHESIQTTFDTYGHLFPDAHAALRAALHVGYAGLRARPRRVGGADGVANLPAGRPVALALPA